MSVWDDSVVFGAGQQYGGQVQFYGDVAEIEITSPSNPDIVYRDKTINLKGKSSGDKFTHGIRATIDGSTYWGSSPVDYGGGWEINNLHLGDTSGTKRIFIELYRLVDSFTLYTIYFDVIVENDPPWVLNDIPDIDFLYNLIPQIYRKLDEEISLSKPSGEQYPLKNFLRCFAFEFLQFKQAIEQLPIVSNINYCPVEAFPLLAELVGAKYNSVATNDIKRQQIKNWVAMLKVKGTRLGISTYIRIASGWPSEIRAGDPYIFVAFDGTPDTLLSRCMGVPGGTHEQDIEDAAQAFTADSVLRHIWGRGGTGPAFVEIIIYGANTDPQKAEKDELLRRTLDQYIAAGSSYLIYYED